VKEDPGLVGELAVC